MYLYLLNNNDWIYEKKYKYGFTKDPLNRIEQSHEQHSYLSYYHSLYIIKELDNYELNCKEYDKIISLIGRNKNKIKFLQNIYKNDFIYLSIISDYLVNNNGSTEFIYENGLEVFNNLLLKDFLILGLEVKKISLEELENINKFIENKKEKQNNIEDFFINLKNKIKIDNKFTYIVRPYQEEIINKSIEILKENNKIYLELATGGGKSVIAYKTLDILKPNIIIILSPRQNINKQNIKKDYINILNDDYKVINEFNEDNKKDNKLILSCCIQSWHKIFKQIILYDIKNIFIWIDEAHWGLDITSDEKKFLLEDNIYIKYRFYTSASPDKEYLLKNKDIYGDLYKPITVKELINKKWLCNCIPHIFSINKEDPDIIHYILNGFIECNKKFGFSFHNNCNNAIALFMIHYNLYIKKETLIKPFILISNTNQLKEEIFLEYDYKNIKIFENTENSIGYVVQQYNIGYDFNNLDIIFMSDPKLSHQDIIQSIGRGMRPDKLGINGENLNKELDIYLPVHIDDDYKNNSNKYNEIKEVLKYLLYDVELSLKDIKFENKFIKHNKTKLTDYEPNDKYLGTEEVKSIILNLIKEENKKLWNTKKITEHLLNRNIHNSNDYKEYINKNEHLNLPSLENLFIEYSDFIWYNTYKNKQCPYYTKKECIKAIKKINSDNILDDYENYIEKIKYLNSCDSKIPDISLIRFYGGNLTDYI